MKLKFGMGTMNNMSSMTMPTLLEFDSMFPDDEACFTYLISRGVFYNSLECEACKVPMKRYLQRRTFMCNRRACQKRGHSVSMRKGTFFFESSLSCIEIMRIAQLWLAKASRSTSIILTGHSSRTITAFYGHFRTLP